MRRSGARGLRCGRDGRGPNAAPRSDFVLRCSRACSTPQNIPCTADSHLLASVARVVGRDGKWRAALRRATEGWSRAGRPAKLRAAVAAVPAMNSRRLICPSLQRPCKWEHERSTLSSGCRVKRPLWVQSRHFGRRPTTSGLPLEADIVRVRAGWYVANLSREVGQIIPGLMVQVLRAAPSPPSDRACRGPR